MAEMHQRIKTRMSFILDNPTLQMGEHGLESDTGLFKIGNGVSKWNALDYYGAGTGGGGSPAPTSPNVIFVVQHGDDANFPRPDVVMVYWIGDVEPLNALDVDLWNGDGEI